MRFFDSVDWQQVIQQPDWYIRLYPQLKSLREQWEREAVPDKAEAMKREVRQFFETALSDKTIALGQNGPNLDVERKPIDRIIIHHTGSPPGYSLPYMNAVQMLNVYVPYFNDPTNLAEKALKGRPLWSGHVRNGQPVFYLYHWLMRMDGSFERLLEDDELGWHAANWDINCRSIAICLDNNYEIQDPEPAVLQQLATFIAGHYSQINAPQILGHKEVSRHKTVCPGGNFLDSWKRDLMRFLKEC